jgi:hypothetical protein
MSPLQPITALTLANDGEKIHFAVSVNGVGQFCMGAKNVETDFRKR